MPVVDLRFGQSVVGNRISVAIRSRALDRQIGIGLQREIGQRWSYSCTPMKVALDRPPLQVVVEKTIEPRVERLAILRIHCIACSLVLDSSKQSECSSTRPRHLDEVERCPRRSERWNIRTSATITTALTSAIRRQRQIDPAALRCECSTALMISCTAAPSSKLPWLSAVSVVSSSRKSLIRLA